MRTLFPVVFLFSFTVMGPLLGCKKSFFKNTKESDSASSVESASESFFSPNDVSFLYPAPPSGSDVRVWAGMPTPAKKIPFPAPFNAPEGTLSVDAEPTLDGIANLLPEQGGLKPLYINPIGSLMTRGDLEEIILKTHEEALRFTRPEDPLYVKGSGAEFYPSLRWKNVWRVTGFRIDPCFGRLGAKSNDERYNSQNPFDALNNMKIRQDMEQDPKKAWGVHFGYCKPLLRVVAMPFFPRGTSVVTNDVAMHLIYSLGQAELFSLIQDLWNLRLKKDSEREAMLGVHPRFKFVKPVDAQPQDLDIREDTPQTEAGRVGFRENQDFSLKANSLLLKYASWKNLSEVEYFGANSAEGLNSVSLWSFAQFEIRTDSEKGRVALKKIPYVQSGMQAYLAFKNSGTETFKPAIAHQERWDDAVNLANFALGKGPLELSPQVKEALEESYRIEDPRLNNFKTTDCASCHTSYPLRLMLLERLSPEEKALFDNRGYPKDRKGWLEELGGRTGLDDLWHAQKFFRSNSLTTAEFFRYDDKYSISNFNIGYIQRNFGYFARYPAVSPRVVNETAYVARFLDIFFAPALLKGAL